jgi:cobalt/nickel transport system permease protein
VPEYESISIKVTQAIHMHISEGVLSGPVLISGAALAVAGTAIGLKKIDYDQIAKAGMLSAAFFVASLIHVPIGPANAHLILSGLVGLLLGWGAFPVIMVGLILQAMFFQFGGLTTLGVNTIIMALPAIIGYFLFKGPIRLEGFKGLTAAFLCGFVTVFLSGVLLAVALLFTEENFFEIALIIAAWHIPVMIVEGFITAGCVAFLKKAQPEMLPDLNNRLSMD